MLGLGRGVILIFFILLLTNFSKLIRNRQYQAYEVESADQHSSFTGNLESGQFLYGVHCCIPGPSKLGVVLNICSQKVYTMRTYDIEK
jgi:hypothetical protein